MDSELTALITAGASLLTGLGAWFASRAVVLRQAPKATSTANELKDVLREWKDDTDPKVTKSDCDTRHTEVRKDFRELVGKLDTLTQTVSELVGEMRATRRAKRLDTPS
jgi:hypothetical protein